MLCVRDGDQVLPHSDIKGPGYDLMVLIIVELPVMTMTPNKHLALVISLKTLMLVLN